MVGGGGGGGRISRVLFSLFFCPHVVHVEVLCRDLRVLEGRKWCFFCFRTVYNASK